MIARFSVRLQGLDDEPNPHEHEGEHEGADDPGSVHALGEPGAHLRADRDPQRERHHPRKA